MNNHNRILNEANSCHIEQINKRVSMRIAYSSGDLMKMVFAKKREVIQSEYHPNGLVAQNDASFIIVRNELEFEFISYLYREYDVWAYRFTLENKCVCMSNLYDIEINEELLKRCKSAAESIINYIDNSKQDEFGLAIREVSVESNSLKFYNHIFPNGYSDHWKLEYINANFFLASDIIQFLERDYSDINKQSYIQGRVNILNRNIEYSRKCIDTIDHIFKFN